MVIDTFTQAQPYANGIVEIQQKVFGSDKIVTILLSIDDIKKLAAQL